MSDANQTIEFIAAFCPPIAPGPYTLTVRQNVQELDAKGQVNPQGIRASYSTPARTVHVQGERFSIDPRDIHSVYPPEGGSGDYGNDRALPHITFSRKSLPWDQAGGLPTAGQQQPAPWLALLVFHETDEGGLPAIVSAMVGDLSRENFRPGATLDERPSTLTATERIGTASYADLVSPKAWALRPGENAWDGCQVVDIPSKLFAQIAPTRADLPWLAHARLASGLAETRTFSTVIANRLPLREGTSMACLVSLADIAQGLPPAQIALANGEAATHLRLVALKAWSFRCGAALQGFNQDLSTGPLKVPYTAPGKETPEDLSVKEALAMGYTALDHNTRWGDQAVSWYRGPFLPFSSKVTDQLPRPPICAEGYETGTKPISCADEALRYDPELGMQDVSYAAAWQLGRLIALRDETFARDLYHWKRKNKHRILAPQAAEVFAFLAEVTQAALDRLNPAQAARDLINDPGRLKAHLAGARAPESVVSRLDKLRRLEGVPLDYLVPDERMLPPESLRFFQVDQNWVYSLIEGAYSIARVSTDDQRQDAATCPHEVYRQVSGFLLRSKIVSGWPQLEALVDVSNRSSTYRTLRCERITPDILLYMVEVEGPGVITSVTLQVPPESVEFQLPKGAAFRDSGQSVIDVDRLAQGERNAAYFARKLTGLRTPAVTVNQERETLSLRIETTDKRSNFEWQFFVDDRPFGRPIGLRMGSEENQDQVDLEIPVPVDLPHGEIVLRLRQTDADGRHPSRWIATDAYHRAPPGIDAQPRLLYRVGDNWITAEWPVSGDLSRVETQLIVTVPQATTPKPVGAVVAVEASQNPAALRAVLNMDPLVCGQVQVRYRLSATPSGTTLPGAWRTSTAFLTRLNAPLFAGGETSCQQGILRLRFYDQPENLALAVSNTMELRLTPYQRLSKRGPSKPTGPTYTVRGSGAMVNFTVPPADLPAGRYQVEAQMIGQDDRLINSTTSLFYHHQTPLRILGRPRVTLTSPRTLTWNTIEDAARYQVTFQAPESARGYWDRSVHVPASDAPHLDIGTLNLSAATYQVFVQAFLADNSFWSGPVSEPVLVTVHGD